MQQLSIRDLIEVAVEANVLKRMGEGRMSRVVVDYIPPRQGMAIPRDPGEEDVQVEPFPPEVIPITYTLESAQFGGAIFAALACGHRVIINPFPWISYEHLASSTITFPEH